MGRDEEEARASNDTGAWEDEDICAGVVGEVSMGLQDLEEEVLNGE